MTKAVEGHEIPIVSADKIEIEWIEGRLYSVKPQKGYGRVEGSGKAKTLKQLETIMKEYREKQKEKVVYNRALTRP